MYDITYTHKTYAGSSRPIRHTNSQRAVRATPMSRQRLPSMRRSWSRPHDDARAQTSQTSMRRVPHAWDARVSVTYASKRQAHHGTLRAMIAGYSFESRWFQRIEGTARAQGTKKDQILIISAYCIRISWHRRTFHREESHIYGQKTCSYVYDEDNEAAGRQGFALAPIVYALYSYSARFTAFVRNQEMEILG